MERKVVLTQDGSSSLFVPQFNQCYHSIHGAIQESEHIFIHHGLNADILSDRQELHIFEMGFGTGLNALLTMLHQNDRKIYYTAVEKYPLEQAEIQSLNYVQQLSEYESVQDFFSLLHQAPFDKEVAVTPQFSILKLNTSLLDVSLSRNGYNLVYFDAFSPDMQPELWSEEVFLQLYQSMTNNSILLTYSTKGIVKRALRTAGFTIEKLPGPAGKREILRAKK